MEIVIIVGIVLAVLAVAFFLKRAPHPEDISGHEDGTGSETRSDRVYGKADRPAGPDAEAMDVAQPGDPIPGQPTDGRPGRN